MRPPRAGLKEHGLVSVKELWVKTCPLAIGE
jgi:hypothetical protein